MFTRSYFSSWNSTQAVIVGVEEPEEFENDYCPKIEFQTVKLDRNITTVLDTSCVDDPDSVVVGDFVSIWYDPSEPTDVVDYEFPNDIDAVMIYTIIASALFSCCYVSIGVLFYKATKSRNNNNSTSSNGEHQTSYSFENNHPPSSIPMTNLGGNNTRYSDPNGYSNNNNNIYTSSEPVETTASAVFVSPNAAQPGSSAFSMASVYPEVTTENTGIGAREETPPMVGCALMPSNTASTRQTNSRLSGGSQTYVSPNSLPLNPVVPTSSYVSPSDIHEARATVNREYR